MVKKVLYPHVPKSRTKGTRAFKCMDCGYAAFNVVRCPRCGSFRLREMTFEETQKEQVHPQEQYIPRK
jgi:primosomal protein N'